MNFDNHRTDQGREDLENKTADDSSVYQNTCKRNKSCQMTKRMQFVQIKEQERQSIQNKSKTLRKTKQNNYKSTIF